MILSTNGRERERYNVSLSLPWDLIAAMRKGAEDEGTSISEQYERAVALYLEERQTEVLE